MLGTLLLILLALMLLAAAGLSIASRWVEPAGLAQGRLAPCPPRPNCVCSESADEAHRIAPIRFNGDAAEAWQRLIASIEAMGGHIRKREDAYLHATFATPLMRYIDDVEARLDREASVIHLRSASRVGHSDLGANRKRVEMIRQRFAEGTSGSAGGA